ncbi:DUF4034 domain-containing protein [Paucibacter sp. R3-3]|uniref:DUF4034 domain-containing protein n=1 Tax=Roseateles agri TaxID=3098619 RepID=A0ABU5DHI9_9BURK|nr:DUF4034 domain-containing protein [Paucibacter sp. R3-3]MDY0745751.1 DUF4034 domain-containing protein [Paucibacter sp. R3-3]
MKLAFSLIATAIAACLATASPTSHARVGQDDVAALLLRHDYATLERSLSAVQQEFEAGQLTELELKRAFEPFAALADAQALQAVREWVAQSPDSYVAHLALGLSYRVQGSDARGRKYWEDTTPEQRKGMLQNFALAEPELRRSITLTAKPYLSLLNLMSIAANMGNRPVLNATLVMANEALPDNRAARLQYARYLLPRWSGSSYDKLDAFVAQSRAQGVAEGTLLQIQAIELNDRGQVLSAEHHGTRAREFFRQALQLARQAGDIKGFRASYLASAIKHVCKEDGTDRDEPICQAAQGDAPAATTKPLTSAGNPGQDMAHAVVMPAVDHFEGVRTEYAWLALRHPGATRTSQALLPQDGRVYDLLSVTTTDSHELKLYFDITAFAAP